MVVAQALSQGWIAVWRPAPPRRKRALIIVLGGGGGFGRKFIISLTTDGETEGGTDCPDADGICAIAPRKGSGDSA